MTLAVAALGMASLPSCYDSRWGQQKVAQQHNAAAAAPAALRTDDGESPSRAKVERLRVRAYLTQSFTAQVVDAPRHLRDLFEDTNRITERDLGVHLELVETRTWDVPNEDDLDKTFETLRGTDAGDGVDYVAGFVGALPRATRSFHEVGKGSLVGKYVVVRAPSSAERHDNIEKAFDELPEDQRRDLEKRLRRHRATAVFLHEIGHTLGSVHETSPTSIMFPDYNAKMTAFGPTASMVMRAAVGKHGESDVVVAGEVLAALEHAPDGVFVASERAKLVEQLKARSSPTSAARGAPEPAAAIVEVPETPELEGADRQRFDDAYRASARGDMVAAWNAAKPLFEAYPRSFEVQDLRCQVASRSMRFELARRECGPLMKLSTTPTK